MFDFSCIYLCLNCEKYYSVGNNKTALMCEHCGSKQREQTASIDVHAILARFLNEDAGAVADELKQKAEGDEIKESVDSNE